MIDNNAFPWLEQRSNSEHTYRQPNFSITKTHKAFSFRSDECSNSTNFDFCVFCVATACVLKSVINVLKTLTVQQMESGWKTI